MGLTFRYLRSPKKVIGRKTHSHAFIYHRVVLATIILVLKKHLSTREPGLKTQSPAVLSHIAGSVAYNANQQLKAK